MREDRIGDLARHLCHLLIIARLHHCARIPADPIGVVVMVVLLLIGCWCCWCCYGSKVEESSLELIPRGWTQKSAMIVINEH